MARVVVVGAGVGGLAAAARLAAAGHEVTVFERADTVGGKLGRHTEQTPAGAFRFDTGPSLLTLPQVFADLFDRHRRETRRVRRPGAAGPDRAARLRGRHRARLLCRPAGLHRPDRRGPRRRGGRRLAAALAAGRPDLGGVLAGRPAPPGRLSAGRWPGWPGGWATWPPSRPAGRCAAWAAACCATRACGCCWTGTPPTPAPTRAGRPAALVGRALRGAGLRRLVSARRAGHARRRAALPLPGPGRGGGDRHRRRRDRRRRWAGTRGTPRRRRGPGPRRRGGRQRRRGDGLPRPAAGPRAGWPGSPIAASPVSCCCSGSPAAPAWPTTTCSSPPTTTPSSTRSSAIRGGAYRPGPRRTRRSSSPSPTTRWSVPTGTRRGSCWSTPPGTAGRRAVSTGAGPGLADAYADRVLAVLAARGVDVRDRLLFREVRTPADLAEATGGAGRRASTAPRADCCARPTAPGAPACSWSAAPPIPAAGCRWSPSRRRSSPTGSARPDASPWQRLRAAAQAAARGGGGGGCCGDGRIGGGSGGAWGGDCGGGAGCDRGGACGDGAGCGCGGCAGRVCPVGSRARRTTVRSCPRPKPAVSTQTAAARVTAAAASSASIAAARPATSSPTSATETRVGRSPTVTTPISRIPAAIARARRYSCSQERAPAVTTSGPGAPSSQNATSQATSPSRSASES